MYNSAKIQQFISLLLVAILAFGMLLAMRPVPAVTPSVVALPKTPPADISIPWPAYGQASIGADGFGVLDNHGNQKPVPMASITKLITALTILQKKPLKLGEAGPTLAISESDVALYSSYLARNGSVVPIAAGQRISQYKAMQAMLIPSANNMADSLAIWAFGSMEDYVKQANLYLKSIGLTATNVADASGFSTRSASTSDNLVALGIIAMKNPVISTIVSQPQMELPLAGVINNTNRLLGSSRIVGIKTGNTEEAGGCYLFAATHEVAGQSLTIVGAVLGSPSLYQAMVDSQRILAASKTGFGRLNPIVKNQVLAIYNTPWGAKTYAVAKDDIEIITWQSRDPKITAKINTLSAPGAEGAVVGNVKITSGAHSLATDVVLKKRLPPPSPAWRIFH